MINKNTEHWSNIARNEMFIHLQQLRQVLSHRIKNSLYRCVGNKQHFTYSITDLFIIVGEGIGFISVMNQEYFEEYVPE